MRNSFSPEFLAELGKADDAKLFSLLGELIQPSSSSPIEWSDDVADLLLPLDKAYSDTYQSIDNHLEEIKSGSNSARFGGRVSDVEFDYKTAQAGGRYFA